MGSQYRTVPGRVHPGDVESMLRCSGKLTAPVQGFRAEGSFKGVIRDAIAIRCYKGTTGL